jgi:radical SAM superfamily enzyme YgiQ (UPF0313 family)
VPHLTTLTLAAILDGARVGYEWLDTTTIWNDAVPTCSDDFDVVLLSTTFIWDWATLRRAVVWLHQRWSNATLVLGGQYSNLKFARVLRSCPEVSYVLRGDAEQALPALIAALASGSGVDGVPNLVGRGISGRVAINPIAYADLNAGPSPVLAGTIPVVPYESMRGCPFRCGFCSFPHASPRWRHRSPARIAEDWGRYKQTNATTLVKAMDSTFTVPPARMRALFSSLPQLGVRWEAYSRSDVIIDREYVDRLEQSNCASLSFGFESMNDVTLVKMKKGVTVADNRRAHELLSQSGLGYRCSFMVGYPGETPADYQPTQDFITREFEGYLIMSVFSLQDETMPVWKEADRYGLVVGNGEDYDYAWSHTGMDEGKARVLLNETLDQVRRRNDNAVLMHWQALYEHPLLPLRSRAENLAVEKAIERLGMVHRDYPEDQAARDAIGRQLAVLAAHGIQLGEPRGDERRCVS